MIKKRIVLLFAIVYLACCFCGAYGTSAEYSEDLFSEATQLCREGRYQEALTVYQSSNFLHDEEKQALALFVSYYPAIFKNGTYDFSALKNSSSSAYAAAVKIEKTYKNNSKYYVKQIYLITEAALYVSIDDIFNQGFHEKGVSFATQVDSNYNGPFKEEILSLVRFIAPGSIKAEFSYFDLSLEKKAEIIAYANERYRYYDSLSGSYSGDMLTDTVFADTAEEYGLTVNDISMVWFDNEANDYYQTHYSTGTMGTNNESQASEQPASETMVSDAIQLLSAAQTMLLSCDAASEQYSAIVSTRQELLLVLGEAQPSQADVVAAMTKLTQAMAGLGTEKKKEVKIYTATKETPFSVIIVTAGVSDGEIKDCIIFSRGLEQDTTDLLTDEIKKEWAQAIVLNGSAEVDAISGATLSFSAEAVKEAVNEILSEAHTETSTSTAVVTENDPQQSTTIKVDQDPESSQKSATSYKIEIGRTVTLGTYSNKGIEWIVIDREGENSLLLSKDIIEYRKFNEYNMDTCWENSTLRAWLNGSFLQSAFSDNELIAICPLSSNNVIDSVFLLNKSQMEEYSGRLSQYNLKSAASTEYALSQLKNQSNAGNFWLGSDKNQSESDFQPYVNSEGGMRYSVQVTAGYGVRPAIWVKTAALFGEKGDVEKKYQLATEEIKKNEFDNAMSILATIPDYMDSRALLLSCKEKLYLEALQLQGTEEYAKALVQFQRLENYADSQSRGKDCFNALLKIDYDKAISLMENGEYHEAYSMFLHLSSQGYYGAYDMCKKCEEAENDQKYQKANDLMNSGEYDVAIATYREIVDYLDSAEKIKECKYLQACDLTKEGRFNEAYAIFSQILGYKDVSEIINKTPELMQASAGAFKTIGSIVTFGQYEQDNDASNGKEPIEWIVLNVQGGKALLMSRKIISASSFSDDKNNVKWEDSNIRAWLNNGFMENSFNQTEKRLIEKTHLTNLHGSDTDDYIFLISNDEFNKIGIREDIIKAEVTNTASAEYTESYSSLDSWWLRSGNSEYIDIRGGLGSGALATKQEGIRPCLWIDIDKMQQ